MSNEDMNSEAWNQPVHIPSSSPYTTAVGKETPRADDGSDKFRIPEPFRLPHGTSTERGVYRDDSTPATSGQSKGGNTVDTMEEFHRTKGYQGSDKQ